MERDNVGVVSPNTYKSTFQNKISFSSSIFRQLDRCLEHGSFSSTDKESLRKFERSVKMLEAFLITFMTEEHKALINDTIKKSIEAMKKSDMNEYYECIRLRFMYLMRILNKVQDMIPEERAMEEIGGDDKEVGVENPDV